MHDQSVSGLGGTVVLTSPMIIGSDPASPSSRIGFRRGVSGKIHPIWYLSCRCYLGILKSGRLARRRALRYMNGPEMPHAGPASDAKRKCADAVHAYMTLGQVKCVW